MSAAAQTPYPPSTRAPEGTLRFEMEARRTSGKRFRVREAIGVLVPLCTELTALHAKGKRVFVYPSGLRYASEGAHLIEAMALTPPSSQRDRACLAPEARKDAAAGGDERSSVFAIGAMFYELITGASVGPGMLRPSEIVPGLPPSVESVLGKALVADPAHRPGDLSALAQALYHVAPEASIAPPPADESHLDHDENFDVDVSLSMLPPPPSFAGGALAALRAPSAPQIQVGPSSSPYDIAVRDSTTHQRVSDPTRRLAEMKAALEADPRPRYVVIKDGMDHGPFNAVELLQQIASGSFTSDHALRDAFSGDERLIREWDEFAPFAEQTHVNREIVQERKANEAATVAENKGTRAKTMIGAGLIGLFAAGATLYWYQDRKNQQAALTVQGDTSLAVDIDGGLGASKKGGGKGIGAGVGRGPVPGGETAGNRPIISSRGSCEAAIAAYSEEYKIGNNGAPPDLTAGAYGAVLGRGSYLNACSVPPSMSVEVCAAVQNGQAVGVTVRTSPPNPGISSCVAGQVRSLAFPSHPRMDVARTTFAAQ